jgi:hypothetical protein
VGTATSSRVFEATERLAHRVLGGSVVFFIGAGFSLDSEGNSAERLIARLLARLLAMGTTLAAHGASGAKSQGRAVVDAMRTVFELGSAAGSTQPALYMTADNLKLLAREYYKFNEWAASALAILSDEMLALDAVQRATVSERAHQLENFLLASVGRDQTPLERIDWDLLKGFMRDADRGKALFLDTMGFANAQIMGGKPRDADIDTVAHSYGGRLKPRHHAVARLAREGWLPCVVTTNYDLLLEGAYRLSGLSERGSTDNTLPIAAVRAYSRIAGADQFFARGESYRTALLLKIHGCVDSYRDARNRAVDAAAARARAAEAATKSQRDEVQPLLSNDSWAAYLPALVFTYREIQTWRADAWSRDLIRTMLRTQTLALCGYSGADPVMHSTFREVYEEMAHVRAGRTEVADAAGPRMDKSNAPVFFFDVAGKRDFHGFEILRAATEASGYERGEVARHDNHIEFAIGADGFPTLDDHCQWLVHTALRELQAESLESRLRRLAARLLGGPCADADHRKLCGEFAKLRAAENQFLAGATAQHEKRRAFGSIVGWTWHFLPGLLRELALAELVESRRGPGHSVRSLRRQNWYFPATERPDWTAWAAVVELAVRRMIAVARGGDSTSLTDFEWSCAEDSPHAAVSFALTPAQRQPLALCVRMGGYERVRRIPPVHGAFRGVTVWELCEHDVPWRTARSGRCPSAATVWQFALGADSCNEQRARYYLGAPV